MFKQWPHYLKICSFEGWWVEEDLNLRPHAYQALPTRFSFCKAKQNLCAAGDFVKQSLPRASPGGYVTGLANIRCR